MLVNKYIPEYIKAVDVYVREIPLQHNQVLRPKFCPCSLLHFSHYNKE